MASAKFSAARIDLLFQGKADTTREHFLAVPTLTTSLWRKLEAPDSEGIARLDIVMFRNLGLKGSSNLRAMITDH